MNLEKLLGELPVIAAGLLAMWLAWKYTPREGGEKKKKDRLTSGLRGRRIS